MEARNNLFDFAWQKPKNPLKLRIPYMGGKQLIANTLIDKMLEIKPNAKYFVDLFGGGGSMSFMALQYGLQTHYNELQKPVVMLMDYIINRINNNERSQYGIFPEDWYKFISREKFHELKNLDTEYGAFAKIIYSFGNNLKGYMYGTHLEKQKELIHNICVYQCEESLNELNSIYGTHFTISNKKDYYSRILDYKKEWNIHIKENPCFQEMISSGFIKNHKECTSLKKKEWLNQEQTQNLERIENLEQTQNLERIENLEQIENLKQTQNLERIENLEQINLKITNLDYRDVIITTPIEETIVYCDIPYRNTETYNKQTFDYEAFYDFFRNNKYTCFLSEYNAPFNCIFEIPKMKLLNNTNLDKRGYVIEKLYFNRLV